MKNNVWFGKFYIAEALFFLLRHFDQKSGKTSILILHFFPILVLYNF